MIFRITTCSRSRRVQTKESYY